MCTSAAAFAFGRPVEGGGEVTEANVLPAVIEAAAAELPAPRFTELEGVILCAGGCTAGVGDGCCEFDDVIEAEREP